MEMQALFNAAVAIVAFLGGWVLNNITRAIERLDADVRELPAIYVIKNDYHRDIDEVKTMLNKIFEKLDSKADK
jgi:low affinity Fe/Cu permease